MELVSPVQALKRQVADLAKDQAASALGLASEELVLVSSLAWLEAL